MHLVYCLTCTVCRKSCDGRSSWLKHLCQDDHQNEARSSKEIKCWRGGGGDNRKGMRDCSVVIFCSFSLSDPDVVLSLLEKLSMNGDSGQGILNFLVTDFVWWPKRDTVAYVQFESREAVQQLFDDLSEDSHNLKVDNKLVQLKRAGDLLKLEWKALLPSEEYSEQKEINPTPTATHAIPIKTAKESSLQTQYTSILKSMEIPKENFNYILEIVNLIKEKLQEMHPSGQVVIFRNYHLRLKNSGSSTLLLFAYVAENPDDPHSYLTIDRQTHETIFNCPLLQNRFPDGPFYRKRFDFEAGTPYQNGTSGFRLNFVTHPLSIVESQLSLLLQYLCTFDPHVKPLLTLVHFWARTKDVHLADQNISVYDSHSNCPDPLALEWLVILFLTREGLLPTTREILNRPHKPLVVTERKHDIGFSEDPQFPKIWRKSKGLPLIEDQTAEEQLILEVVDLAGKFFEFYSTSLESGCWVLNPKDGEILKREGSHIGKSQLTKEETELLKWVQESPATKPHLLISNFRIFILHPLYICWRLSFNVEHWEKSTCQNMRETAEQLKIFLAGNGDGQTLETILGGGGSGGGATYASPRVPLTSLIENAETPLSLQFNSVCKAIEIPSGELNYALEIFKNVEQLFKVEYPNGQMIIFRNYYLGLRNTGTNTLLIYAFVASPFDPNIFVKIPIGFQLKLAGFLKKRRSGDVDGTTHYEHQVSKFRFHFVTFPLQIVEAHLSLLMGYLCSFDPRVKPVLTLVYFWARSHDVKIAEEEYPDFKYHSNCPEPVALEWMVILFLGREGVIPKVREILERPHVPLLVSEHGYDIGLSMDPEYSKEWRRSMGLPVGEEVDVKSDLFVLGVVELARRFFEFFGGNLGEGCWVLNPKDGEIIRREGGRIGKCGLSLEEMERLAIVQSKETTREHLIIGEFRIFMLHPLYITWKLSFDVGRWTEVTCGGMRRMGEDLGRWLKGDGEKRGLEEVLAGGKGKVKEVQLELSCENSQNLRAAIRTKLEQRKLGEGKKRGRGKEEEENAEVDGTVKKMRKKTV